ncbi:MAG: hypothetical protein AAGC93_11205 [Cyanobacteria bacterium P01_F01_bin.53]
MKEILAYIEKKQASYAELPFFDFLRDRATSPEQRLAFAPCFAFFVMGFGELNKHAFRVEPTTDPVQAMINQHTYEDDSHWVWFLEDLKKLDVDYALNLSDALKFLWSEENNFSRWTTYRLYQLTFQADPIQKLVVIEAIEATADIFLGLTSQIADELQGLSQQEYKYFGQHHYNIDANHTIHSDEAAHKVEDVVVPEAFYSSAYELVDEVFALFTEFSESLHGYCVKTPVHQNLRQLSIVPELSVPELSVAELPVPERAVAELPVPELVVAELDKSRLVKQSA